MARTPLPLFCRISERRLVPRSALTELIPQSISNSFTKEQPCQRDNRHLLVRKRRGSTICSRRLCWVKPSSGAN